MKIIKATVVFVIMLMIFSVPLGTYLIRFKNTTPLGKKLKNIITRSNQMVSLFNLNEPGDAKFLYSDLKYAELRVNLVTGGEYRTDIKVGNWIEEMIADTVMKKTNIEIVNELTIPLKSSYTDSDLNDIREKIYGKVVGSEPVLNIVYLSKYAEKPTSVGLVIHRDTIFIFSERLDELTEKGYIGQILEKTTIMHEWGHLLGLDHINEKGCIMNELVEVSEDYPSERDLPRKYCREELDAIKILNIN